MPPIGRIEVPEIQPAAVFPVRPEYGSGRARKPEVYVHSFQSGNVKIEQRFLAGTGATRFHVVASLDRTRRAALRSFWDAVQGAYGAFFYDAPNDDCEGTTRYVCRFEDPTLTYEYLSDAFSTVGVNLVEIPQSVPEYARNSTETRFPGEALEAALLDQVQILVPLLKLRVAEAEVPDIYLSNRNVLIGGQLHQARLLDWDGISQSRDGSADDARFVLGNADRVLTELANDTDLLRARLEFALFHVATGIQIDLWTGYVTDWSFAVDSEQFALAASDGLYALNLPYPLRRISRTCWKDVADQTHCFAPPGSECNKSFANCQVLGQQERFGGIGVTPQAVRVKDNSTGVWGFGRSTITSVSLVADSIYSETVPEYYVNNSTYPLKVNAKLCAGRDEGDFYIALGLVGEGPLGAYAPGHKLDGQPNHGPGAYGLRESLGDDPNPDPFALGAGGQGQPQQYGTERAAGTAFVEIRRSDPKGLQLSKLPEHAMEVLIAGGRKGYTWSAPGARNVGVVLTNPIWIAVNMLLRALGLQSADADVEEQYFDVQSAVDAAAVCDEWVESLVERREVASTPVELPQPNPEDGGLEETPPPAEEPAILLERQFQFTGGMVEEKPLRDWLQEVLNNCLGYFVFRAGKLAFGIRSHSGATEPFTEGNVILGTLQVSARKPQFNDLTVNFADEEYGYVTNSVRFYDIDHAKRIGGLAPRFEKANLNLAGTSTKSQAVRIATVRLREELGGVTEQEQKNCRDVAFRTTVLALASEPGKVGSITHPDMPGGYGEFRIEAWRLRKDFSIEISGRGTTDSMYDLVAGPKPADVAADPVPGEPNLAPADWNFEVEATGNGKLSFKNFTCKTNAKAVDRGVFEIYYVPEAEIGYTALEDRLAAEESSVQLRYSGEPPADGEWALVDREILAVEKVASTATNAGVATVKRGKNVFGDEANEVAVHDRIAATVVAVDPESNAVLTLQGGLALAPGMILSIDPEGEWQFIAEYDPATGRCVVALPFENVSAGTAVSADPRVYRVAMKSHVQTFAGEFFKAPGRARYSVDLDLPFAGVVAVRGYLETQLRKRSNAVLKLFTTGAPPRLRTLGTTQYLFTYPGLPTGLTVNAFATARADQSQSFESAFTRRLAGSVQPIPAPRSVDALVLTDYDYGGTITLGGAPAAGDQIFIEIGSPATEAIYIQIPPYTLNYGDGTELGAIAAALRDWLNGTEQFVAFYSAEAAGNEVRIMDRSGVGGAIQVGVAGSIAANGWGLTSKLGILKGRRYALSYRASAEGYESDLSALGASTGPTGGASRIEINDLPATAPDARVDRVVVWASEDGKEGAPCHEVASVTLGTEAVVDTLSEEQLLSQSAYPGPAHPPAEGPVKVTVDKDGGPWFELRIPAEKAYSNVIDGLALNNVAKGTEMTVDIDNGAGVIDLDVVIQ